MYQELLLFKVFKYNITYSTQLVDGCYLKYVNQTLFKLVTCRDPYFIYPRMVSNAHGNRFRSISNEAARRPTLEA